MKTSYILTGFTQTSGLRVFVFDQIGEDRRRTKRRVSVDLAQLREYKIPLQEMPLLCCHLLEEGGPNDSAEPVRFSAEQMSAYARAREEASLARKPHRQRFPAKAGAAWRTTPVREG